MLPKVEGFAKQVGSIAKGVPVGSVPADWFGLHVTRGRALISPPVKLVTVVEVQTVLEPVCFTNPGAQGSPVSTLYVPPEKVAATPVLGLPIH